MSARKAIPGGKAGGTTVRKPATDTIAMPSQPPMTPKEEVQRRRIMARMKGMAEALQQNNLDNAVRLAQQAARHKGPLIAHFAELGRRFATEMDDWEKPALRVITNPDAKPK